MALFFGGIRPGRKHNRRRDRRTVENCGRDPQDV